MQSYEIMWGKNVFAFSYQTIFQNLESAIAMAAFKDMAHRLWSGNKIVQNSSHAQLLNGATKNLK